MKMIAVFVCALLFPVFAHAYMVPNALPLDDLIKESPIIVKATVLSSEPTADDTFRKLPSWAVFSTRLKVISVLKGALDEKELDFHHFDDDPGPQQGRMYAPNHYHFEKGKTYILFAKSGPAPGQLRPLWDYHRSREDQGQLRAADDRPIPPETSIQDALYTELANLVQSKDSADVRYAIAHLHEMSIGTLRYNGTADFPREKVLVLLAPLINHPDKEISATAIDALATRSPYRGDDFAMGWLATIGKGKLLARGHGTTPPPWDNPEARQFQSRLLEVANKAATPALRAQAIRAFGLSKEKSLLEPLRAWSKDSAPEIRSAAAVLWSDFPGEESQAQLTPLAADPDPAVRKSVAAAVGFSQEPRLLPLLDPMLRDKDEKIRAAAALSLISFDPADAADLLKKFGKDPDFRASFINALALADAKPYLDDLAQIVQDNQEPKLYFTAQMPVYTSWLLLKDQIQTRTPEELAGGKLDKYLDALENPPNIGSGPVTELYRLYLEKGLTTRAANFRDRVKEKWPAYLRFLTP
jgi:HEAT repeat protein